jgi:hypothetical protein
MIMVAAHAAAFILFTIPSAFFRKISWLFQRAIIFELLVKCSTTASASVVVMIV